jgi:hypothetical protein
MDSNTYLDMATLAAHASYRTSGGFRARDVKFLAELFSNWVDHLHVGGVVTLHNTQVKRYLDSLVSDALCTRTRKDAKLAVFCLSRAGLLELSCRISKEHEVIIPDSFLFRYWFIRSYGKILNELVRQEGAAFPEGLRLELTAILDDTAMLKREISRAERRLEFYRSRIRNTRKFSQEVRKLLSQGLPAKTVYQSIEREYPYQLNSMKPLSELLGLLPSELAKSEMTDGSESRVGYLWHPIEALLTSYLQVLRSLLQTY